MRSDQSPFPCYWWGTSIEHIADRSRIGTYGRYSFAKLPRLPVQLRGDFDWLADAIPHKSHIGQEKARQNRVAVKALQESARQTGIELPASFVKFMQSPILHEKIRSTTDCFLDVCPALVKSPIHDGYLVRFLADSQGCVFWYLFVTADGRDYAVVSSPDFYGTPQEYRQEEIRDPSELVFSEESFESFLCRFWLENEICFSQYQDTPLPGAAREYLESYRLK